MILDHISNGSLYRTLHPGLAMAFRVLIERDWAQQATGRHEVRGANLYVNVDDAEGRGHGGAVLEAHRLFIDVQLTLVGCEEMGWRDVASCQRLRHPYDAERDIIFYDDAPQSWITLPDGYFAVFFPSDAHAPLAGTGPVKKAIAKVAVQWP